MKHYKLAALNSFFKQRQLPYQLPAEAQDPYLFLSINKLPIYARLANTSELVAKGLMGVSHLDEQEGCLLDFRRDTYANLWMKNCKINLQAAMIDRDGQIIDIVNMYYKDPYYVHKSSQPIRYALEMNEEFFTKNNIKVGMKVRI
jgi:uncharacterized membrane protein (UPF0127 family)